MTELEFLEALVPEATTLVAEIDDADQIKLGDRADALRKQIENRRDALRGALSGGPRQHKPKRQALSEDAADPVPDELVLADIKRGRLVRHDFDARLLPLDEARMKAMRALASKPNKITRARR